MQPSKSIYDTYSTTRRRTLLALVAAVYPLLPLSDTILLTQMPVIAVELGASSAAITATMSLYLLAAGAGFALWGPVADMLGRQLVYHTALGLFLASSVGSALAPTIAVFLLGRTVQGLAASGTWSVGNAVVADIYPIEIRGVAYGVFMMPGMFGPVVAPFIGAALTQAFGWRSMMWFLAALSGAAQLAVLLIYRETQHHRVARKLLSKLQQQQLPLPEWVQQYSEAAQPAALSPRQLLLLLQQLLADPTVLFFLLLLVHAFGCMFLLLLQFAEVLSATTSLSATNIGLCYLATGGCSMAGSLLGGWAADKAAAAPKATCTARLEWGSAAMLLLLPAGLVLVGWTEQGGLTGPAAVAAVVVGGSLVCLGSSFATPGVYSYLSHRAGEFAAAVGSLAAAGGNIWPAALIQLNPLAHASIGTGVYNTIVGACAAGLALGCCCVCVRQRQHMNKGNSSSSSSSLSNCQAERGDAEVVLT